MNLATSRADTSPSKISEDLSTFAETGIILVSIFPLWHRYLESYITWMLVLFWEPVPWTTLARKYCGYQMISDAAATWFYHWKLESWPKSYLEHPICRSVHAWWNLLGQVDSATTFSTTKLANHQTSTKHCPPAGGFKHGAETQCLEKSLKVFKVTGQYQWTQNELKTIKKNKNI